MAADLERTRNSSHAGETQSHGQAETPQQPKIAAANGSVGSFEEPSSATQVSGTSGPPEDDKPIPKEMIGWYFVEQYYNTMSKNPEKLYLYYTKRSQFVSGDEAEKVPVAVGQRAIGERIKELDIEDCKVRVSNVDSQESFKNILVQVIGEMSNKAAPHRKFVQSFVLAEQPTGYYVLNDVFRYILEDDEQDLENEEAVDTGDAPNGKPDSVPANLTSSSDPAKQQHDADHVDELLEKEVTKHSSTDDSPLATAKAVPSEAEANDNEVVSSVAAQDLEKAAATENQLAQEVGQVEDPKDPEPTPIASPPKPAKSEPVEAQTPAAPPKPAAPKTWANLVAANRASAPALPNGTSTNSSAPSAPPKLKATTSSAKDSEASPTPHDEGAPVTAQQNGNSGWQMAGADNNKKQSRQHSQSVSSNKDSREGYLRNVTDKVDASILKAQLAAFGKLGYFDVNRQKNCAFVDFVDSAAYNTAVAANPLSIGGEQIYLEERRPRASNFNGNMGARGGMRGGRGNNDNRPGSQGRGGYTKEGSRGGNYTNRNGRGGAMTSRGRGQPQAA